MCPKKINNIHLQIKVMVIAILRLVLEDIKNSSTRNAQLKCDRPKDTVPKGTKRFAEKN